MQQRDTATGSPTSANEVKKNIHRASLLLVGSILVSRVIGFAREWVLAQTVGANSMTDVYLASFTIPDFLNYLMAAGALSISFIPMLSGYLSEGQAEKGKLVFRSLTTWMGGTLLLLVVILEVLAGQLAYWVAPGFSLEQIGILTYLIRIILPAQFFFYWGGLAIAVQQTHGRFLFPALAPIFYNLGIIVFGIALHASYGVAGFSIGVLMGSLFGHGLLQWWGLRQLGYGISPYFGLSTEIRAAMRRYLWLSLPIMLGFSIVVTDEWISKYFASSLEKRAITWLSYARTEMRIPIAVIGQVAGIASFPYLSRLWSQRDFEGYGRTLIREIQKLWAAAPVAAILLIQHSLPLTSFIFGGSRLTPEDLQRVSEALQMFGIGVFFWIWQVLLARGFYACQKTWLPSLVGTGLSILSIPLYGILERWLGFKGLALAGSLAIIVYSLLLWGLLIRHLRKHCPTLSLSSFYRFAALWTLVLVVLAGVSEAILRSGIYRGTRLTGLADILVAGGVVSAIAILLLRKVFAKQTDGALF